MKRLLLDTTFLVDAERSRSGLENVIDDEDDVAIAAVTIAELRVGSLLARGRRATSRSAFVDDVASSMTVVDYDRQVAEAHAVLLADVRRTGRPRGAHDLIIAATARATGRAVVTADADAFVELDGIEVLPHR